MRKENAVANYFIALGLHENEDYMTNLRLNKLMYFAQACCLSMHGTPLFDEKIEAWDLGPVIPSIYRKYKHMEKRPIERTDPDFSIKFFSDEELQLLSAVMVEYGKYSTSGLVNLSHIPGGAWEKARNRPGHVMNQADIIADFSNMPKLKLFDSFDGMMSIGHHNAAGTYVLPTDWKDEDVSVHG